MKSVIKALSWIALLSLVLACGTGCSRIARTVYPANTVVVVNGEAITEQDLQNETMKREIAAKALQQIQAQDSTVQSPTAAVLHGLGLSEGELSDDQKRYIDSLERNYPDKPVTPNLIFNESVRQEVLYQEAVSQGFLVSNEEAQETLQQMKEASEQAEANDSGILAASEAILKEYGFDSEDDYLRWNLPATARSLTVQRLQNKFDEEIAAQHPELDWFPLRIARSNAWEDYTEFLVKNSVIEIKQDGYELQYYGKPWEAGRSDLQD